MAEETKSVFLFCLPTKVKRDLLITNQKMYTNVINDSIEQMIYDKNYFSALLNNNKKAPIVRRLEKSIRKTHKLGSAYGQNTIDHAVKELHNHITRIKYKMFGYVVNNQTELLPYLKSNALLNAAILDTDEIVVIQSLIFNEKEKEKPNKNSIDFYEELLKEMVIRPTDVRSVHRSEIRSLYYEKLETWKVPFVKRVPMQLDGRVSKFEKAEHIDADYVISVKLLGSKKYVDFPLKTSKNSLRRLEQYKNATPSICFIDGKVKVTVPFTKKVTLLKTTHILAADAGITDMLAASNGKRYGSFSNMSQFFEQTVEKKNKQRSKLRSKMRLYQKKAKTATIMQKKWLRNKISNIAKMLCGTKKLQKEQRRYQHQVSARLSEAIKPFVFDVKKSKCIVAIENLEISNFDRGVKTNKRDSSWVRGELARKLKETLMWSGIPVIEVDPAYTSQECSRCHCTDQSNRNGKIFCCTVCNLKEDADYQASLNIKSRATDDEIFNVAKLFTYSSKRRHRAIKEILYLRHETWLKANTVVVAV